MTTAGGATLTQRVLDRTGVQPFLPLLQEWLLPDSFYAVQHTWPQLYRSDGHGAFLVLLDGDRLIAHTALATLPCRTTAGLLRLALVGSVATDPAHRRQGHAGRLLHAAIGLARAGGCDALALWAEAPGLYARAGFRQGHAERCLALGQPAATAGVRPATVADHPALHALHCQKPMAAHRAAAAHSGLLTTPGMTVAVLERDGAPVAYACCGKGADLQGWWHELGGADDDLAVLLPGAMALAGQDEALLILPPYRPQLPALLGPRVLETATMDGPMVLPLTARGTAPFFLDGLDSV